MHTREGPIVSLSQEERHAAAESRLVQLAHSVEHLGCKVLAGRSADAFNFYAQQQTVTAVIDRDNPSRISLLTVFGTPDADLDHVQRACYKASERTFVAKAKAHRGADGIIVTISVAVIAEEMSALLLSLPSYLNDLMDLYDAYLDEAVKD